MDPLGKANLIASILATKALQKKEEAKTTDEKIADKRTDNTRETARINSPPARVQSPILTAMERTLTVGSELAALVLGEQLYKEGKKAFAQIAEQFTSRQGRTVANAGDASPAAVQAGLYAYLTAQLPEIARNVMERLRNRNLTPEATRLAAKIFRDLDRLIDPNPITRRQQT